MSEFYSAVRRLKVAIDSLTTKPTRLTDRELMISLVDWLSRNPHFADFQGDVLYVSDVGLMTFLEIRNESRDLLTRWHEQRLLDRAGVATPRLDLARKVLMTG